MAKPLSLKLLKSCNIVVKTLQILFVTLGLLFAGTALTQVTKTKFQKMEAEAYQAEVTKVTLAERTRQLNCLAKNVYWEAGSEPFEGKVAVAQVTMNRVASGKFSNDICDVVYQRNIIAQKTICQFSWVCEPGHKFRPVNQANYTESYAVAKKVLLENFRLESLRGAMYFHATYVNPGWGKKPLTRIGNHIFYKG